MSMKTSRPDVSRFWFVQEEDLRTTPSMDYHEHSKISEYLFRFNPEDPKKTIPMMRLINAVAGRSKDYAYCPGYPLAVADWDELKLPLGAVLSARRTRRDFVSQSLPGRELGTLLVRAIGVNGELRTESGDTRPLRVHPSGGALFPLETYVVLLDVADFLGGLYHFDPYGPQLRLLAAGDHRGELAGAFIGEPMISAASAVVIITAVFVRSAFKYAERSYRFILLEAGHAMQNLVLVGQAIGLSVVPMGGFFDRRLEHLVDADGVEESVIYAAIIGKVP
jgi:SagB-type dehydrogenase family enzyme